MGLTEAGFDVRWHRLTCVVGQAALDALPPGSVALPLVVIDRLRVLQRPDLDAVLDSLHPDDEMRRSYSWSIGPRAGCLGHETRL